MVAVMTQAIVPFIALASAADLLGGADAPEWVHLLPVLVGNVLTFDGRGPYKITDAQAVIQASLEDPRGLPIDENHATDLAAPDGRPAPARGWIVELQARKDGVWGRVEWTEEGRALVKGRAYRGLSPVLSIDPKDRSTVRRLMRASLVNTPNLKGLTALNQENPMTLQARLAEKLGLKADATEDDIVAACVPKTDTALQSAITEIGTALGVEGGDAKAIVAAAKLVKATGTNVVALQTELNTVKAQLETVTQAQKRAASTAFIDGALKAHRAGVNQGNRDELIALHMEQPAVVEKLIGGMPQLGPTGLPLTPPPADGSVALNAEQLSAAKALGISVEAYTKTLKADQETR
jgi:phage I-like protein